MGTKYYIAVDCEGVACAVGYAGQGLNGDNYSFARLQATREADAAARALFDAGAEEVVIWDNHHFGVNLDYDQLDPRCKIFLGAGHHGRFIGLDSSYTAVLFIGYHAMEGTADAVLAHTYSSKAYQWWKLNGQEQGEMEIDAACAGEAGVPVLFCASDDRCVAEAKRFFGPIATVETKKSLSWNSAISRHPAAVCEDIYRTVLQAAREGPQAAPYRLASPVEAEIRFKRLDEADSAAIHDLEGRPFERVDGFTRRGLVRSVQDLFR